MIEYLSCGTGGMLCCQEERSKEPKGPADGDALFDTPRGDDRERGAVSTTEPRGG